MREEFAGKTAIITGGASGLGRASAELFAREGAQVVIADINEEQGQQLARELGSNVRFHRTDVAEEEDIQRLIDYTLNTFGGLHVMFNNAGITNRLIPHFLDDDLKDFHRIMGINLLGVMLGTQYAGRHMAKHGGGSIINTASIGGSVAGLGVISYRASKAAVIHFSKCAAIDLAKHNIRVNVINPGHIRTPLSSWAGSGMSEGGFHQLQEDLNEINLFDQPIKRYGTPEDVAEAALFLASDRSRQITGIEVAVDGGTTAGDSVNHVQQILNAQKKAFER